MHCFKQVAFATKIRAHCGRNSAGTRTSIASALSMGKRKATKAELVEEEQTKEQIPQSSNKVSRAKRNTKSATQADAVPSKDTDTTSKEQVTVRAKRGKKSSTDQPSHSNDVEETAAADSKKPEPKKRRKTANNTEAAASADKQQDQQNDEATEKPKTKPATAITGLWLMKNEPEELSMDILLEKPNQTFYWDGVRSYQARNFINQMKVGDKVLFYYSSCKVPGLAGIVKIVKEAYPDHTAWDPKSPYYDPKSDPEKPRWMMVDVQFERKLDRFIPLEELRTHKEGVLKDMMLFSHFRLSVQPLSQQHWDALMELEKKQPEADSKD